MSVDAIRAPHFSLLVTEPLRATAEFGLLAPGLPLLWAAPRGDGHAVMVLPGMAANDRSTMALRGFLRSKGYAAYGWKQGRNIGSEAIVEPLRERIARLRQRHGGKLSLVGWSLGGLYARELAKLSADEVRCVITLGSPFKGPSRASNVGRLYEWLSGKTINDESSARLAETPPVPTTAVFTRADGIVAWQRCIELPGEQVESIEVAGSHSGLGHNPLAMYAVADRLAQPEGNWQPFAPKGAVQLLYRNPWRDRSGR